ncbi:MAG: hypothetical protein RBU37_19940, partial [Myxococcota bacterium]|nr:hypothetical protein [Myxococcota bacterium]
PRPAENSRANESVSCEVCHTISAIDESKLYNFSFFASPGRVKYGARGGESSPVHDLARTDFHDSAKLCANCHNEQSPWGIYVKGTYNEWLEGPYAEQGVQCQTCHMPSAPGQRALTSAAKQDDMRQHLFLGGHVSSKVAGAIEVMIHPDDTEYELGDTVVFSAHLFNGKAGHKIPTGSVEDRMLYLVVEAQDAEGKKWTLAVDRKGFNGEEYTIAGAERAYRDFREMMDLPADWDGLPRDGAVPAGSRIFRMPYFTESGEMTICQWNTASFGADYRIGPRENKIETYTWDIPDEAAEGELRIHAALYYQLLVDSVADFLEVPDTYKQAQLVSEYETSITIFD